MDPSAVGAAAGAPDGHDRRGPRARDGERDRSLEPGKKADFVLFDLDHVEWAAYQDPLQALVWSASSASIRQTWVGRAGAVPSTAP